MTATSPSTDAAPPARPTDTHRDGVTLRSLLDQDVLDATVVAGRAGLDRIVERVNVMEVPDILDFVRPNELLVTTAYPLRERSEELATLVQALDDAGLAGLGVKLGRYLDELPTALVAAADERDFPVMLLPDTTSFDVVLNDVLSHVLSDQAARLRRSEHIHRTFLQLVVAGGGVDAIAGELARLVEVPTAIVALDGAVLAQRGMDELVANPDGDEPQLELSPDTEHLRVGSDHLRVAVAPAAAGPRLFGHVVALADHASGTGREHVAGDDRMALESAATVTALALSMESEIRAVESKYQSDLMHDLMTGRIGTTADALRRARTFGWDLDRPLITLVLRYEDTGETPDAPSSSARRSPLPAALANLLRQRDPRVTVVRFSEEVVVLTTPFEGDDARTTAIQFLQDRVDAARRSTGMVVSGGLSRPVHDVTEIPRGYDQAVNALTVGRRVHGTGHVAHFDELGAHRVLSLIDDVGELRAYANEVLGDLAVDDETTNDLRHTLEVLLETNLNVAESARRLHFHYNTLRYRIEKLEGMIGPFMDDARVRLNVQLALLIHDMRGI